MPSSLWALPALAPLGVAAVVAVRGAAASPKGVAHELQRLGEVHTAVIRAGSRTPGRRPGGR
jgi:hypothetical protein